MKIKPCKFFVFLNWVGSANDAWSGLERLSQ